MTGTRLAGLLAAGFSPMGDCGELALELVPGLVEAGLGRGVTGFYVCGSTGEWASLSTSERKQVASAYIAAVAGRVPVVVQVGDFNIYSAQELAAHAEAIGADGISASFPSYYPGAGVDTLVTCMSTIAAAAPSLPFYYYHIPSLSRTSVEVEQFLRRAREAVPSLAGIKYSGSRLDEYLELVEQAGSELTVLFGCDEQLLHGLVSGAKGAIGSTYNFLAPLYLAVWRAYDAGDLAEARRLQAQVTRMVIRIISGPQPLAGIKAAMSISGAPCGPVRLPQRALTQGEYDALARDLEGMGFLEWTRC